jgi:hypothetical protein
VEAPHALGPGDVFGAAGGRGWWRLPPAGPTAEVKLTGLTQNLQVDPAV